MLQIANWTYAWQWKGGWRVSHATALGPQLVVLCARGAAAVPNVVVQVNGHVQDGREHCRGAVRQPGSGAQLQAWRRQQRV